jgi:hypothetical protein
MRKVRREKEIARQRHLLGVGLMFTVPLFILSMTRDIVHQAMLQLPAVAV